MEQCEYWCEDAGRETCDLVGAACKCGGSCTQCDIHGCSITDVVRQAEQITLLEASNDAQRRRRAFKEAS